MMNLKILLMFFMAFASLAVAYDENNPEPATPEEYEQDYQDYLDGIGYEAGFIPGQSSCARGCYFHPRRRRCMSVVRGRCTA